MLPIAAERVELGVLHQSERGGGQGVRLLVLGHGAWSLVLAFEAAITC